jgi:hypothetical protein
MYVMATHNVACARMGLLTCLRGLGWLGCAAVIMCYMIGCGSAALSRRCHGGAELLRQRSVDAASTRRQRGDNAATTRRQRGDNAEGRIAQLLCFAQLVPTSRTASHHVVTDHAQQ